MIPSIKTYCDNLTKEFKTIPDSRKEILEKITQYIKSKQKDNKSINLVYICTHNSRRSHFGQIWAHVAASYYKVKNVNTFSGGSLSCSRTISLILKFAWWGIIRSSSLGLKQLRLRIS